MRHVRFSRNWTRALFPAMLVTLLAVAAVAGDTANTPADRALPQGEGSPGIVTFNHSTHVDMERPDCTACHPRLFSILHRAEGERRVTHAKMEQGAQCGACHGRTAFGMDDCTVCHR